jgi:hypothetical protein
MSLWLVESREEREEYLPRFIWADQIRYDQSDLGPPLDSSLLLHINIVVRQLHVQCNPGVAVLHIGRMCLTQQTWSLKLVFHADRFIGSPRSTSISTKRP